MNFINNVLDIIKHIPKKYIVAATIFLIIVAIALFHDPAPTPIKESTIEDNEIPYILNHVDRENIKTKEDLILPEPTGDATEDFKKYNFLKFENVQLSNNVLSLDITNTHKDTIKLLSITIFDKESELYEDIFLNSEDLEANGVKHIEYELQKVTKPQIQKYSYFRNDGEEWISSQVDLKNNAAYSKQDVYDNSF